MARPKFPKAGPGRPKGSTNKVPATVKASVLDAFMRLGGSDGMLAWAMSTPTAMAEFYKIASRLIPTEIAGADGGPLTIEIVKETHRD
jgi:hypothetical protein